MNDFEVLSCDAVESVESERDVETPDAACRIRAELDGLLAELAEAKETVAYLEARENELVAEKAELARWLAEEREDRVESFEAAERLRLQEVARLRHALDAARNDVAYFRRAAFWFAVSSFLGLVVAVAALAR